jgi:hypothetical protein
MCTYCKFSPTNSHSDEEDMTDDQPLSNTNNDIVLNPSLGEHSFKSSSLEDLVKSFDNTINDCFSDEQALDYEEESKTPQEDLIAGSNTWSELIENLRTSLRNDLKLPNISQSCQTAMNSIYHHQTNQSKFNQLDDITSIDDLNEDEEEELREQLDMHSIIISSNHEPFLTAEQVISEIDFMLQDMTPDSGYCDDQSTSDLLDLRTRRVKYLSSSIQNEELNLKTQTTNSLNELYEELNTSIKELSSLLVQELAIRDELEYEKETKNTFISLVLSIQNKRRHHQGEKRPKRRSLLGNSNYIEPGTYLTTVIPYDRDHPTYLSVEHLQSLNKILHAINEDSSQVPELLTKYILNVLCPC